MDPAKTSPFGLKHFSRSAINFSCLQGHLLSRIVEKHPASTQLKLLVVSTVTSEVVDRALESLEVLHSCKQYLDQFTKCGYSYSHWNKFPVKEGWSLRDWSVQFLQDLKCYELTFRRLPELFEGSKELRKKYLVGPSFRELVEKEGAYGPREIDFNRLPRNLRHKFIEKASLVSVTRLAVSCSLGRLSADTFFLSNGIASRIMVDDRERVLPHNRIAFWTDSITAAAFDYMNGLVSIYNRPTYQPLAWAFRDIYPTAKAVYELRLKRKKSERAKRKELDLALGYTGSKTFPYSVTGC